MELRTLPELLTKLRLPPAGDAIGVELVDLPESNPPIFSAKAPGITIAVTPEEKLILEGAGAVVTNSFGTMKPT